MKLSTFVLLFCSLSVFAFDCTTQFATAFGTRDVRTASYDKSRGFTWYDDQIVEVDGVPTPQFKLAYEPRATRLWNQVRSFAIQPQLDQGAYAMVLDGTGVLKFYSPDRVALNISPESIGTLSAATLFKPIHRELERDSFPVRYLRSVAEKKHPIRDAQDRKDLAAAEKVTPTYLYVASDNHVYRTKVVPTRIAANSEVARALLVGPVRVTGDVEPRLGQPTYKIEPIKTGLVDFQSKDASERVLIPSTHPEFAYQLERFERVITIKDRENLVNGIDFIHVLSDKNLLLANNLGQVIIVEPQKLQLEKTLSFPGKVWLNSISAHQIGDEIQVWAINSIDKSLYYWNSTSGESGMTPYPEKLPDGEIPLRVTSSGQIIPVSSGIGKNSYYYNHYSLKGDEIAEQRVLVMTATGKIFGLVDGGKKLETEFPVKLHWESQTFTRRRD